MNILGAWLAAALCASATASPQIAESNTPPARGERHPDRLKPGDPAPDFTLVPAAGGRGVALSEFRGQRPVVLIFGSYT